jgi:hypothetical protein
MPSNSITAERTPEVYCCELDGEFVVFHPVNQVYYRLRDSGAAIWRLLSVPNSIIGLTDALSSTYDVPRERCLKEVQEFVAQLEVAGLVRTVS